MGTHYRLVDLPWNSPWTWILTAVLVDLGYYWFHRASHEIGALWAVHQALPMEILRCSIGLALVMVTGGWKAGTLSATALSVWLGFFFAIAVAKSFVASGAKEKEA